MTLKDIMQEQNFVVCGDTLREEKYAYKIKNKLIENGYEVEGVGKEKAKIDDVSFQEFVLDLCINPNLGISLLREMTKQPKCVVLQPGAGSDEIKEFLNEKSIPYLDGCLLVGMKTYPQNA